MHKYFLLPCFIFFMVVSCKNKPESLSPKERALVLDSVELMAESIAKTISGDGPVGWLKYFENTQDFFMASDGQLVFPNIDTATSFINNILVKSISKITLHWSDIRIDPLTTSLAGISAAFHEDITDASGKITPHNGYFTGIAHQTSQGWKLRNAHWSGIASN